MRGDDRRRLTEEGERLAALFRMAQSEARVGGRPLVWEADLAGYRFPRRPVADATDDCRGARARAPLAVRSAPAGEAPSSSSGREPLREPADVEIATRRTGSCASRSMRSGNAARLDVRRRRMRGFTLIEVLVALAIVAVALLAARARRGLDGAGATRSCGCACSPSSPPTTASPSCAPPAPFRRSARARRRARRAGRRCNAWRK